MRSHDVCHSVIERVILSASNSLDHCTQVVKFQEDYMKILAWTLSFHTYYSWYTFISNEAVSAYSQSTFLLTRL